MALLIHDCPRCGVGEITFDIAGGPIAIGRDSYSRDLYEIYAVCRACDSGTVFRVGQSNLDSNVGIFDGSGLINGSFDVKDFVSIRDLATQSSPDHVPDEVASAFNEAATCMAVECWNAAGAMFRACIDLATKGLLPEEKGDEGGPNRRARNYLSDRLTWLFENARLPRDLEGLSDCVREDGNDGAHDVSLGRSEAEDLLDFTRELLERIFTEPARVALAKERRDARRRPKGGEAEGGEAEG